MHLPLLPLLSLPFLLVTISAQQQQQQQQQLTCVPTTQIPTTHICHPYITYTHIQTKNLQAALKQITKVKSFANFTALGYADLTCHGQYINYMCAQYLPACYNDRNGTFQAAYMCKGLCELTRETCRSVFKRGRKTHLLPDCTQVENIVEPPSGVIPLTNTDACVSQIVQGRKAFGVLVNAEEYEIEEEEKSTEAVTTVPQSPKTADTESTKATELVSKPAVSQSVTTFVKNIFSPTRKDEQEVIISPDFSHSIQVAEVIPIAASDVNITTTPRPRKKKAISLAYTNLTTADAFQMMSGSGRTSCPAPLIPNPKGFDAPVEPPNCPMQGCCIPCPLYQRLYPVGVRKIEITMMILNLLSIPALLLTFYLIASRPGAWKSSKIITVLFSLLNVLGMQGFEALIQLGTRGGYDYMCVSATERSVDKLVCTLEGALYTYFGMSFAWAELLFNINLAFLLFFHRPLLKHRALLFASFAVIWLVCGTLTIIPYLMTGSEHTFGTHCNPRDLKMYRKFGIYPIVIGLACNILLAMLNVGKIIEAGYKCFGSAFFTSSSSTLRKIIAASEEDPTAISPLPEYRSQAGAVAGGTSDVSEEIKKPDLNPAVFLTARRLVSLSLMVAISCGGFLVWWFMDGEPKLAEGDPNNPATIEWGQQWILCLVDHASDDLVYGGQTRCSAITAAHVPLLSGWALMEILSGLTGLIYFVTLGTSSSDWRRIWDRFFPKKLPREKTAADAAAEHTNNSTMYVRDLQ